MTERQILVVGTGGSEAVDMLRSIRSAGVFCVLAQAEDPGIPQGTEGIVVIGGENPRLQEVLEPLLQSGLPILAFGAPASALCTALGGSTRGIAFEKQLKDVRFANTGVCAGVEGGMRMLDGAEYLTLPKGFRTLSVSEGVILGFDDGEGKYLGFQFLPETQDIEVSSIVENFLWHTVGLAPDYSCEKYALAMIDQIRREVGDGQAVCLLSGGVDSTTAACLARQAVGDRLHCIVVDTGLGRPGEVDSVVEQLGEGMGFDVRLIHADGRMMETLRSCVTPQQKRHAVAVFIAARIADEAARLGGHVVVVQSTNYMDVLEVEHSPAELPGDIPTVSPLKMLFKDEVRQVARMMEIPDEVVVRQHYPSAGTALRCMGVVDAEKLETLRQADQILRQTLQEAGQIRTSTQAFALLADVSGIFCAEDKRYIVVLRVVSGEHDGRANIQRLPQDLLERIAERIMNEVEHIYRVVFDLSSTKVEWE